VNGNQAPSTNLSGPATSLANPADIVVTASGVLIAVNLGAAPASLTVYPNASTANGNVVPARNVQGASTGLNGPVTIAISTANDLAFVANNAGTFDINVFAGASTAGFLGNLAPTRTIKSAALNHPFGINFGANDQLYVANNAASNIVVFNNASTRNGVITPDRTLTNAAFAGLFDCFVDAGDRLYVVNGAAGGNKIHVINAASTKNGAVTIDSTLTVTGAVSLTAIAVDKNQTGYIVDNGAVGGGAIYAYDTINTKNGAFAPSRSITGATTQLAGPIRVFLVE
jgi:sugar lactone lactonase YvrE